MSWLHGIPLVPFFAVLVARWGEPPAASAGDYAHYLLHAKALVRGDAYADIGYFYTDLNVFHGPPLQPPGWPLLLSPVVALFGAGSPAIHLLVVVLALMMMCIVGWLVSKRLGRPIGIATAAIFGMALLLARGFTPGADIPFALVAWLLIAAAQSEKEWTWPRFAVLLALALVSATFRIVGVSFFPALILAGLLRSTQERRRVLMAAAAISAAALAALLTIGGHLPFLSELLESPAEMLNRVANNIGLYPRAVSEATLYPLPWDYANDAYHLLMLVLVLAGTSGMWRGQLRSPLAAIVLAYGLTLTLAPVRELRYAWPFYPIIIASSLVGLAGCAAIVLRRPAHVTSAVTVAATLICAGAAMQSLTKAPVASFARSPSAQDMFAWLRREKAIGQVRVMFENPRVLTLETGVAAMPLIVAPRERMLEEFARLRITHIIVGALDQMSFNRDAVAALEPLLVNWDEVWRSDVYRIYRISNLAERQ